MNIFLFWVKNLLQPKEKQLQTLVFGKNHISKDNNIFFYTSPLTSLKHKSKPKRFQSKIKIALERTVRSDQNTTQDKLKTPTKLQNHHLNY